VLKVLLKETWLIPGVAVVELELARCIEVYWGGPCRLSQHVSS